MDRLWALQTEHFYDHLLIVSARDDNQPKRWVELPWDETKYLPPLNKRLKLGETGALDNLEGDAWNEYMKKESARLLAEHENSLAGNNSGLEERSKVNVKSGMTPTTCQGGSVISKKCNGYLKLDDDRMKNEKPIKLPMAQNAKRKTSGVSTPRPKFKFAKPNY